MLIKNYLQFITEKQTKGQLQQLALVVSIDMPDNKYIYDSTYNTSRIWNVVTKENLKDRQLEMPILNYSNYNVGQLVKAGYDPKMIYNKKEAKNRVAHKQDWYLLHKGSEYIPKSVYNISDVSSLKFPIVAKPDNKYAGKGIQVFDSIEDMKSVDPKEFSVFSEKINITEEFRIFCWKGEPISLMYRVPANDKTKDLSKDKNDELEFNYELSTNMPAEDTRDAIRYFSDAHKDLDFYSIDFARTKDAIYVIEMSSEPGPCFGVLGDVYKRMYMDYYKTGPDAELFKQIDKYIKEDIDVTVASDSKRFKIRDHGIS